MDAKLPWNRLAPNGGSTDASGGRMADWAQAGGAERAGDVCCWAPGMTNSRLRWPLESVGDNGAPEGVCDVGAFAGACGVPPENPRMAALAFNSCAHDVLFRRLPAINRRMTTLRI